MKSSRAINRDNMGLLADVSEGVSVPTSGVDVMGAVFSRYIYTQSKLSAAPARSAWVTMDVVKQSDVKTNPSLTRLMARQELIALVL
jgi:hypothetical protein